MQPEVPIQVAVRVRPMIGEEVHKNKEQSLFCVPNQPQIVIGKDRHFNFDYVFPPTSSQREIYEICVKPLIPVYFEGYNTTVFAYGQTGSGKTYTMGTGNRVYIDEEECGIIPRAVTDIFNTIKSLASHKLCKLRVSFIEVYKEETTDLLDNSSKNLQIRDDESGSTVITGLREEDVHNVEDVLTALDGGTAMRHVGSTNINDESSRSHCIFSLALDQYPTSQSKGSGNILSSRFHFVDLAGSERAQRTGNQGERFKESIFINTGLLALGNVISALSDPKRKGHHIPYRESKLTRLLKDSLGGNSKTVMITCLGPALADLDENINSLKYATRAKNIRNKPCINFDIKSSKISRMETEIEVLRGQLQKTVSNTSETFEFDMQKIADLEIENEKHEVEQNYYLEQLHEVNVMLHAVELAVALPSSLKHDLNMWRSKWKKCRFDRPITAPSRHSALRRPSNDLVESLRMELSKCKEQVLIGNEMLNEKSREIEEISEELHLLQNVNTELQRKIEREVKKRCELQVEPGEREEFKDPLVKSTGLSNHWFLEERSANRLNPCLEYEDGVMESFRAKSEVLITQMNDLDNVEYDDLSSDDEEIVESHWEAKPKFERSLSITKPFVSQIPRPAKSKYLAPKQVGYKAKEGKCTGTEDALEMLESHRISARDGARTAELNVREVTSRMNELEQIIQLKEKLISNLMRSEWEARATSSTFKEKLSKVEKEYEKSKSELEESQEKISRFEKSNNKDNIEKSKLENDYKKKLKAMQKKYEDLKQKEGVSNRMFSYQENNEKKVKDLEAWLGRMKNQYIELDRKLKDEVEKKCKYEQESRKNELRIKELELKTEQQQKLLKRKNEEVAAAQRKLRTNPENNKASDLIEQKNQWIDLEIDKIVARQHDIDVLEAELRERDESLKKKEALMREKEQLEVKKTKSSQSLSKSIMHLSVQVESVDEEIEQLNSMSDKNKSNKDIEQLQRVRENLISQRIHLQECEENGGLEVNEERQLIEMTEAIEAIDEAIEFKNELILQKTSSIRKNDESVEQILNDIGDLSVHEYKHLLGKLFVKIINLRKLFSANGDEKCQLETKVREQEKKLHDLHHMLQVNESRHEKMMVEQNNKYEKELQFLMEQLRTMDSDSSARESSHLEKKVSQLEKELNSYKTKLRKYKDYIKGVPPDTSIDDVSKRKSNSECNQRDGESFYLPPVGSHRSIVKKDDSEKKLSDTYNEEDARRLQGIFDGKPSILSSSRSSVKRNDRSKSSEIQGGALNNSESVDKTGENPWSR